MKELIVFVVVAFSCFANARDGGTVGNGGNVVVCKDAQGKIASAELLDLFEGRALYNFQYKEDPTPALNQALKYADQISAYIGSPVSALNLSADVKNIYDRMHFLPPGVGLEPIADSEHFIIPKGCQVVQTVNYRDWKNIFVDSDIWNSLSETQKAALLLHEAIYAFYREGEMASDAEPTSVRARFAVAALFSGAKVESIDKPKDLKDDRYLECYTDDVPYSYFYVYRDIHNRTIAQFRYYLDHVVLTRAWMESSNPKIISGDLNSPFESGVRLQVSFDTETAGRISNLNAWGDSSKNFTCRETKEIP